MSAPHDDDQFDALLRAAASPSPSRALRERVIAAAPRARLARRGFEWLPRAIVAGALISACAAGAVAGSIAPIALQRTHAPLAADPVTEAAALLGEPAELTER